MKKAFKSIADITDGQSEDLELLTTEDSEQIEGGLDIGCKKNTGCGPNTSCGTKESE